MKLTPDTGPDIVFTHAAETADGYWLLMTAEQAIAYQGHVIDDLAGQLAESRLIRGMLYNEVKRLRAQLAARPSLVPSRN